MKDIVKDLKEFYGESRHILSVSYKPSNETFRRTLKVVLLGTIALGVLGYLISLIIGFLIP